MPENILYFGVENKNELAIYFLKREVTEIRWAELNVPSGNYSLTMIDPLDGSIIKKQQVACEGKTLHFEFPEFSDVLLLVLHTE